MEERLLYKHCIMAMSKKLLYRCCTVVYTTFLRHSIVVVCAMSKKLLYCCCIYYISPPWYCCRVCDVKETTLLLSYMLRFSAIVLLLCVRCQRNYSTAVVYTTFLCHSIVVVCAMSKKLLYRCCIYYISPP